MNALHEPALVGELAEHLREKCQLAVLGDRTEVHLHPEQARGRRRHRSALPVNGYRRGPDVRGMRGSGVKISRRSAPSGNGAVLTAPREATTSTAARRAERP